MSSSDKLVKKQSVDPQEGCSSSMPTTFSPMELRNRVLTNSKNPNRNIYPLNDGIRFKRTLSCTSFTNASKLLKESIEREAESKRILSANSNLDDIQEDGSSSKNSGKLSRKRKAGQIRSQKKSKISTSSSEANKIMYYFKPTHASSVKKKIRANSANSSGKFLNNYSHLPGPSGSQFSQSKCNIFEIPGLYEPNRDEMRNYGLIKESSDNKHDENSPCYINSLPSHVLETILCQIPFIDLMKNCLVCPGWRNIINNSRFVEWKKRYYGLKKRMDTCIKHMNKICRDFKVVTARNCFEALLKFMSTQFNKRPCDGMYNTLIRNSKAVAAELLLTERFPNLLEKESKAWVILVASLLISETVCDVYNIYKSLTATNTGYFLPDITDAFYCVATFFLHFKIEFGINHGLHYRVYSALHWAENELPSKSIPGSQTLNIPKGLPGQQNIRSYGVESNSNLTNEQLRILNHRLKPHQIIKIVALAGTGKTTTLIHFAKLYPQMKFLNVVFNKAVCEEAKTRFPPNVTCRTIHSLAYEAFGSKLRHKLTPKIRPRDLIPFLEYRTGASLPVYVYAVLVFSTIEKFLFSTEKKIELQHVPKQDETHIMFITEPDRINIKGEATSIWKRMIDPNNKGIKISHDVYLKLYQLSNPKLVDYHCIMVDEAQDCNLAMINIVMSQKLPVILVGDPNQQIYGFRGAINALESFEPTHAYYLTKSFRFGPEIAYIASCSLEVLKVDHSHTLVGTNKQSYIDGRVKGQYAIIARGNTYLFNEAIRLCCEEQPKRHEPQNIRGCFAGGIKSYNFDQLIDIYKMMKQEYGPVSHLKDKFIAAFKNYHDLHSYARNVDDHDLLSKMKLVEKHNEKILDYVRIIKQKCSFSMKSANVVFSTAHKSKGLEFDTVCLTDDYPVTPSIDFRRRRPVESEESNIFYVALTRAKKSLLISDKLMRVLLAAQEKFEYPVQRTLIPNGNAEMECVLCNETFTSQASLVLSRRRMCMANGRRVKCGPFCVKCATEPFVRPRVQVEPVVMFLDPCADYAHISMTDFVGPLPSEPPIVRNNVAEFNELDVVYVINLNM